MTCWECNKAVEAGAESCACGAIQPPAPDASCFDVLGVPEAFALDAAALERSFRERSRRLHPDRFARAGAVARRHSLGRATQLNDAYRVLRDPVRRAEYLLSRIGITVGEQGASVDPELLMETMERREELAAAIKARSAPRVEALAAAVRAKRDAALARVERSFHARALGDAAAALVELRYHARFLEEVAAFEESLAS